MEALPFVKARNPAEIWRDEPTFLLCELSFELFALLTLLDAWKRGPRYVVLWLSALGHGLTTELVSYFNPNIDSFWHAQSTLVFFRGRFPLHIMLFYPATMYLTNVAVEILQLGAVAHASAVAIADVIVDVPFDIMGIKLVWWTWHDTDPNIFDRHYSVPWTSYIFHMTFAWSLSFLFRVTWNLLVGEQKKLKPSLSGILRAGTCLIVVSLMSMPLGVLQCTFNHLLHDVFFIHAEITTLIYVFVYGAIFWRADRRLSKSKAKKIKSKALAAIVIIHYTFYMLLVVFYAKPEDIRSTGLHEVVGDDCQSESDVYTVIGMTLKKKTFLCVDNYDEPYFDFHCLPRGRPETNASWYTVCGTPYKSHVEYMVIVIFSCVVGLLFFWEIFNTSVHNEKEKTKRD